MILLLLLALVTFAVARGVRLQDDIVNTVELSEQVLPGEPADLSFNTTAADASADVLITDTEDRPVRALQQGEPLATGSHSFEWDGNTDGDERAPPGSYGIRVILEEEDRDIKPPGRIEVPAGGQ